MREFRLQTQEAEPRAAFSRRLACFLCLLIIAVLLSVSACAGQPGEISAKLGQEFSLVPGQSAYLVGEPLKIRFLEVINDSRCPQGVTCVWEGEATCLVEITYLDSVNRKVLTQPGLTGPSKADFKDYEIRFDLRPYPEAGKQIGKQDYRLRLVISKKPALSGGILVTFQVIDERYSIFITNKKTIEQVFVVQRGESRATIPTGRLVRGAIWYNQPWSWHVDSEDIAMAEVTIELCDGKPSHVEANLDYWLDTVRFFCPWSAKVARIEDYR